jgi:hypothetical protein
MLKKTLQFALERKRPHGGVGEEQLARYIEHHFAGRTFRDDIGNVHMDFRGADCGRPSRTLFVAHLDTVHHKDGGNNIRKSGDTWHAHKDVLGADDGAGVAMLCHMAHHAVPGYYIFTRGEERGGVGSSWLVENTPEFLRQFDRAIAFDRKGESSIITEQGFRGRCASGEFAWALAEEIMGCVDSMLMYLPDDTGIYTDTAEFVDIIPECTNISIGYYNEHTEREMLNLKHFEALARAVLHVKWEELPTARDPEAEAQERLASARLYVETNYADGSSLLTYGTRGLELAEDSGDESSRPLRWDVYDALDQAEMGRQDWLKELVAYNAFADSEAQVALAAMKSTRIPREVIDRMWDEMETDTAAAALVWLADQLALI